MATIQTLILHQVNLTKVLVLRPSAAVWLRTPFLWHMMLRHCVTDS
jgi:hypothetical protein